MSSTRLRLSAPARRAAVVEAAARIFAAGSYRGTTTAEIAREAGVSEPVLYRHFASKRDLYLACLDEGWARVRALWETALAEEPDPAGWIAAMGRCYLEAQERAPLIGLWTQGLTEATDDPVIRGYLRAHMREVHDHVAGVIARSQAAGGIHPDRDPAAEAWIFISLGLLSGVGKRLGSLLGVDDFAGIVASRRRWLTDRA